jgi:hypothetical protein
MAYASPASLFMRIRIGWLSTIPTCSLMMPMNPLIPARAAIHTLKSHVAMPHDQNQSSSPPLSGVTVHNPSMPHEAIDALLVSLVQQFAMQLAAWRGSRLTDITLKMEPLQ